MADKIWDFPSLQVSKQLFYVPGMAFDGGFTSGGVRVFSPEPGGRAFLEMHVSLQIREFQSPMSSWIMSKTNGEIFRVRMAKTPQIAPYVLSYGLSGVPWDHDKPWDNEAFWSSDSAFIIASAASLEGSTQLIVDTSLHGSIVTYGHVIGHADSAYMVDDIEYNGAIATITVNPPLRRSVVSGDLILLSPYFTGMIANGSEIRNTYDAENAGHIQMSRIVFQEVF